MSKSGSTGGQLLVPGFVAAEAGATAVGREPIIANPGSGSGGMPMVSFLHPHAILLPEFGVVSEVTGEKTIG